MDILKLIKSLSDILGGKKQKSDGITKALTKSPGSLVAEAIKTATEAQEESSKDLEMPGRILPTRKELAFPQHLGLSQEYEDLVLQRIIRIGPGRLMSGYPADEDSDESTIVDRNVLAKELLWASRRDENASVSVNLGDEAARLLEINLKQDDDPSFACDTLRILYSKRKDWANAARVMDCALEKGKVQHYWTEDLQAEWEKKRARISKHGH